ncbi:MAG TPA: small multi-drug export protein [Cyclobacteriaceae bacterium]|nr:small multi-drug export protein [Cyclobacteriaceae bacterium]HPW62806.1 small multi-drug export protein [Cyclobacteriaceae bacterium]
MWAEILKALSVYVSSMIKFIFGPIGGKAAGLHLITTMVVTAAGMMTVVIAFTYFGEYIRKIISRWTSKKKGPNDETPKKRSEFFRKYGLAGVAFFTPIILTPIGGTLLAVGISPNREKIIFYMLISACVWSVILTFAVYFGYDAVMNFVNKVQPV